MSEKREGDGRRRRSSGVPHVDTKGDPRLGAFPAVDPGSIRTAVLHPRRPRRWAERGVVVEQGEDEEEHEGDANGGASHAVDGVEGPAEDGEEEEQTHGAQQLRHGLRQRLAVVAQEQWGRHHHRLQQAVRH